MMTDPRKACANTRELWPWAAVHDLLAHPFMVLTGYSRISLRFHDFTSHRAWPRGRAAQLTVSYRTQFGVVRVVHQGDDFWRVHHGNVSHAITVKAGTARRALQDGLAWFNSLAAEFGGKFSPQEGGA